MIARVEWLPVGHIAHGYRRVFTVFANDSLRHVVNLVPMPYEQVFHIREFGKPQEVSDPSLWWGLSIISQLVERGILLAPENPANADDGYVQVRPEPLAAQDLLPLTVLDSAISARAFVFPYEEGAKTLGRY